jgi:hypothetical protein
MSDARNLCRPDHDPCYIRPVRRVPTDPKNGLSLFSVALVILKFNRTISKPMRPSDLMEGKKSLDRHRRRWVDNIKTYLKETRYVC